MLKIDDVIHITYGQSMMVGKIKEIGSMSSTDNISEPGPPYILITDPVVMIPAHQKQFDLVLLKKDIYFVGIGAFISKLEMTEDLFKNYIQTVSGLIVVPNINGMVS